ERPASPGQPRGHPPCGLASLLARLLMRRVLPLTPAILLQLEPARASRLLLDAIVALSARVALQPDIFPHVIAPAPRRGTVEGAGWPPPTRGDPDPVAPRSATRRPLGPGGASGRHAGSVRVRRDRTARARRRGARRPPAPPNVAEEGDVQGPPPRLT